MAFFAIQLLTWFARWNMIDWMFVQTWNLVCLTPPGFRSAKSPLGYLCKCSRTLASLAARTNLVKSQHWDNYCKTLVKIRKWICSHVLCAQIIPNVNSFHNLILFTRSRETACFVKIRSKNRSKNKRFITLFSETTSFGGKVYMTGMVANDMRQIRIYFAKVSHYSIGHTNHSKLPQIYKKRTFLKIARELDMLE